MVLGGWFGLHKFMEGNWIRGLGYLLTCGCFGVFYLYDLFSMVCGNYCFKKVSYVEKDGEVERKMQKIYYEPLMHRKRAVFLFLLAVVILVLVVRFVYQPIGNGLVGWLAAAVSGNVTEGTARMPVVFLS
ncbi:MAG: TM2 domain-containing protein [Lachnospiraceae bacterium]|nr:TM2 domain-containing protein [Lachnospiraceae bacterium]